MPSSRTGREGPERAAQALQWLAADQTGPRGPTSAHTMEAGRAKARAATVIRRADDRASDRC
eukprot:482507-Alexandrium_andersonii.AAC.1